MRLAANKNQIVTDADQPWGAESLITLNSVEDGSLTFEFSNGLYLSSNGELKNVCDDTCKYALEFKPDDLSLVAFKASNGSKRRIHIYTI